MGENYQPTIISVSCVHKLHSGVMIFLKILPHSGLKPMLGKRKIYYYYYLFLISLKASGKAKAALGFFFLMWRTVMNPVGQLFTL